jgi:zeta-carotene desaturase
LDQHAEPCKLNLLIFDLLLDAACDVPGIKRLLPAEWREWDMFDNIYKLDGVPVVTVQLRYNGWVTEVQDLEKSR